jgi:hypothetical protein
MSNNSLDTQEEVWEKAHITNESIEWRKDFAGAWISKSEYGKETEYGWGIALKIPVTAGGNNGMQNLILVHWKNKVEKGENYPDYKTSISSELSKKIENIEKKQSWKF